MSFNENKTVKKGWNFFFNPQGKIGTKGGHECQRSKCFLSLSLFKATACFILHFFRTKDPQISKYLLIFFRQLDREIIIRKKI